jgi:hypothetical protein
VDDMTAKFPNTSNDSRNDSRQDEIRQLKERLAELRRQEKLDALARSKQRRAQLALVRKSHRQEWKEQQKRQEHQEHQERQTEVSAVPAPAAPVAPTPVTPVASTSPTESPYAYGARAIGRITGQSPSTVYYWASRGMYGTAVWSAGPKTLMGDVAKLKNLSAR